MKRTPPIISLLNDHLGIYAVRNHSGWYDAGFHDDRVPTVFTATARGGGAAPGPRRARRATTTSAADGPDRDAGAA